MSSDDIPETNTFDRGSIAHAKIGRLWFDAGIYPIEGFILFEIGLFEIYKGYPGRQITLLHLHIGYFHFDIGLEKEAQK